MTADEGKATAKKTYEELERENAELRAKILKLEKIARTLGTLRGSLKELFGQLSNSELKV